MTLRFSAPHGIGGVVVPPADKSITHRAALLAAVSRGSCRVANPLQTGDCLSTRCCLTALGVAFTEERDEEAAPQARAWVITGRGLRGFTEPAAILDAENSGTTTRLLAGLLAGLPLYAVLTGDASLRARPMLRIVEPLRSMGARIEGRGGGKLLPLSFLPGNGTLRALRYDLPVPSAQVKSALLLAALKANGETSLGGCLESRDHTERLFRFLGLPMERDEGRLACRPVSEVPEFELRVPGDISSAAFFLAAALISGRELVVGECGLNPTRLGFVEVLRRMGADIKLVEESSWGGEPVGRLWLRPAPLKGIEIQEDEVPYLIDEIPLVAVLGAFAQGKTRVRGAGELKHKESDRLRAVARMLAAAGGRAELSADGFSLEGPQRLSGGRVDPGGDHRIAMAAAVMAAGIPEGLEVSGFEAAKVSFPDFIHTYQNLGAVAE